MQEKATGKAAPASAAKVLGNADRPARADKIIGNFMQIPPATARAIVGALEAGIVREIESGAGAARVIAIVNEHLSKSDKATVDAVADDVAK